MQELFQRRKVIQTFRLPSNAYENSHHTEALKVSWIFVIRRTFETTKFFHSRQNIVDFWSALRHWYLTIVLNVSLQSNNLATLKGQSNEIFDLQFFFHNSNLPGSLTNWLTYFRFWLRIRSVIRFDSKNLTPRGIIPLGVKQHFCTIQLFQKRKM